MGVFRTTKGFTLLELLLSISIFMSLVAISSYAVSHFQSYWKKDLGKFNEYKYKAQSLSLLNDVVMSIYPQIVKSKSGSEVYYFLGREEGLTAVSYSPIFSEMGKPIVFRLFREGNKGNQILVYEEAALNNQPLVSIDQQLNFQHRLIIAENLGDIYFEYCGLNKRSVIIDYGEQHETKCFSEYDGVQTRLNPDVIFIVTDKGRFAFEIANADRLTERKGSAL